jgi:hypothetical protein
MSTTAEKKADFLLFVQQRGHACLPGLEYDLMNDNLDISVYQRRTEAQWIVIYQKYSDGIQGAVDAYNFLQHQQNGNPKLTLVYNPKPLQPRKAPANINAVLRDMKKQISKLEIAVDKLPRQYDGDSDENFDTSSTDSMVVVGDEQQASA